LVIYPKNPKILKILKKPQKPQLFQCCRAGVAKLFPQHQKKIQKFTVYIQNSLKILNILKILIIPSYLQNNLSEYHPPDGALFEGRAGSGLFSEEHDLKASFVLGTFATVYQAEVYTIMACSDYCLRECMLFCAICGKER
jgi:hypothetical protein